MVAVDLALGLEPAVVGPDLDLPVGTARAGPRADHVAAALRLGGDGRGSQQDGGDSCTGEQAVRVHRSPPTSVVMWHQRQRADGRLAIGPWYYDLSVTRSASAAASRPTSVSRKTRRSPSSTGTWFGTTRTVQPAASADLAPVFESSIARQSAGSTPR